MCEFTARGVPKSSPVERIATLTLTTIHVVPGRAILSDGAIERVHRPIRNALLITRFQWVGGDRDSESGDLSPILAGNWYFPSDSMRPHAAQPGQEGRQVAGCNCP